MDYLPSRITVKLDPLLSRAIRHITEQRGADDPREVVADLTRERLIELGILTPTCPACDGPTFQRDGVWYCRRCNMAVEVAE